MQNNYPNSEFISFRNRLLRNSNTILLIVVFGFSFLVTMFLAVITSEIFFYIVSIIWFPVFFANFMIFRKRARYYVSDYKVDDQKIILNFYDKDEYKSVSINWNDLDFCFGSVKSDNYLTIWHKNFEILRIFRTFAEQKQKMLDLQKIFFQYIPQNKIIIPGQTYFLRSQITSAYTKRAVNPYY